MRYAIKEGNTYYAANPDSIKEARRIAYKGCDSGKTILASMEKTLIIVGTHNPNEPVGSWKKIGEMRNVWGYKMWFPVKSKKRYVVKRDGSIIEEKRK